MITKRFFATLLCGSLLFTSCVKENNYQPDNNEVVNPNSEEYTPTLPAPGIYDKGNAIMIVGGMVTPAETSDATRANVDSELLSRNSDLFGEAQTRVAVASDGDLDDVSKRNSNLKLNWVAYAQRKLPIAGVLQMVGSNGQVKKTMVIHNKSLYDQKRPENYLEINSKKKASGKAGAAIKDQNIYSGTSGQWALKIDKNTLKSFNQNFQNGDYYTLSLYTLRENAGNYSKHPTMQNQDKGTFNGAWFDFSTYTTTQILNNNNVAIRVFANGVDIERANNDNTRLQNEDAFKGSQNRIYSTLSDDPAYTPATAMTDGGSNETVQNILKPAIDATHQEYNIPMIAVGIKITKKLDENAKDLFGNNQTYFKVYGSFLAPTFSHGIQLEATSVAGLAIQSTVMRTSGQIQLEANKPMENPDALPKWIPDEAHWTSDKLKSYRYKDADNGELTVPQKAYQYEQDTDTILVYSNWRNIGGFIKSGHNSIANNTRTPENFWVWVNADKDADLRDVVVTYRSRQSARISPIGGENTNRNYFQKKAKGSFKYQNGSVFPVHIKLDNEKSKDRPLVISDFGSRIGYNDPSPQYKGKETKYTAVEITNLSNRDVSLDGYYLVMHRGTEAGDGGNFIDPTFVMDLGKLYDFRAEAVFSEGQGDENVWYPNKPDFGSVDPKLLSYIPAGKSIVILNGTKSQWEGRGIEYNRNMSSYTYGKDGDNLTGAKLFAQFREKYAHFYVWIGGSLEQTTVNKSETTETDQSVLNPQHHSLLFLTKGGYNAHYDPNQPIDNNVVDVVGFYVKSSTKKEGTNELFTADKLWHNGLPSRFATYARVAEFKAPMITKIYNRKRWLYRAPRNAGTSFAKQGERTMLDGFGWYQYAEYKNDPRQPFMNYQGNTYPMDWNNIPYQAITSSTRSTSVPELPSVSPNTYYFKHPDHYIGQKVQTSSKQGQPYRSRP